MNNKRSKSITPYLGLAISYLAAIITGCNFTHRDVNPSSLPNIVFLFTDDQRFNTIHSLGNEAVLTPNIDRLAEQGISFTRAHIMGGTSGAICMPSRAMLMTGRSLFHLEMKGATIPDDHVMFPEILRDLGYQTFGTGKWHNGKQSYARCFTHGGKIFFGGMSDHLKVPYFDFDSSGIYPEEKKRIGEKFSSELFVDEAIHFLEKHTGEAPFFIYVSFTAPHDPRMAPDSFAHLYPPEKIELPLNFMEEHPFNNGEMKVRDEKLAPWPRTPEIIREHIAAYYAMITHTDQQIGRLLETLDKLDKKDNTIIVFAGDNGLAVGQHGLLGKQNLYEHSVRVPLIFTGPGIAGNAKNSALCYLIDIYPTICDLVNVKTPEGIEGKSLLPLFENRDAETRTELFYAYRNLQRGIRTDDNWKMIKYQVNNEETTQLFDLNNDPWEMNNLANDTGFSDKLLEMINLLDQCMKKYDDPMDLSIEYWGKKKTIIPDRNVNHLAIRKKVFYHSRYSQTYTGGGDGALVDGIHGMLDIHDPAWQGFEENDLDVVIPLGEKMAIRRITIRFLQDAGSWVFLPRYVNISLSSDSMNYQEKCRIEHTIPQRTDEKLIHDFVCNIEVDDISFIRITAENTGRCPDWHPGAGGKAWIFTDEIIVE